MITERKDKSVFTARNRQNPFAKRRQAQAEAQAEAAPYNDSKSPEHVETPDIATLATGGVVERPAHPGPRGAEHMYEPAPDEFPPTEEQTEQANAVLVIPAETQAKIDAVMNHAIPPVELPAEVDEDSPTPPLPDADAEDVEREASAVDEPKRGRGRPRPVETIVRDGKVYDLLKAADADAGVSKEALAISLDEKEQQVYSSLRQLKKEGRAENRYVKDAGYRWFAV